MANEIEPTAPQQGDNEPLVIKKMAAAMFALLRANGGDAASDEYTSTQSLATSSGTIPAGVLSWSISAVSGTVTVGGQALAVGAKLGGGGYGGRTLKTAIAYTISAGSALIAYDTPS